MEQFTRDLESEAVADRVAQDRKQGEAVRLRATPTIYINGREFSYSEDLAAELKGGPVSDLAFAFSLFLACERAGIASDGHEVDTVREVQQLDPHCVPIAR